MIQSGGGGKVCDRVARRRLCLGLVTGAVLAGADEEGAAETCRKRAGDVGFRIVANHHRLLAVAGDAGKRGLEEIRSRLAEQNRLTLRGIFQRRHEGAGVEAEFAVLVLEAAIARERQERGAREQLAERFVERGIGEAISGVADHHSLGSRGRQVREVLLQGWMDQ